MSLRAWKHEGHHFLVRAGTLDASILRETFVDRDYDIVTFRETDVWLDIGAHIGAFAVLASPHVALVRAYEPDKGNFGLFNRNITLNSCRNVDTHWQAIAGKAGTRVLWRHPRRNTAAHSLVEQQGYRPMPVEAVSVNDALRGVTCVKLDAEGAEWEIVRAVQDWQDVRQVVVEYHHKLSPDYDKFVAMLGKHFTLTEYPINERIQCNHVVGVRR